MRRAVLLGGRTGEIHGFVGAAHLLPSDLRSGALFPELRRFPAIAPSRRPPGGLDRLGREVCRERQSPQQTGGGGVCSRVDQRLPVLGRLGGGLSALPITCSGGVEHLIADQKLGPRTTRETGGSPPPAALPVRSPDTSWDTALLKRLENASRAMNSNLLPVSHLRAHPSSTRPYPVLSGNYRATIDPPADS